MKISMQTPNLTTMNLKTQLFSNLVMPEVLTQEYIEDVIFTRYEQRRPAFITANEEVIDSYELKRFLSEWNKAIATYSPIFTNAYNKLIESPEFIDYMEKVDNLHTNLTESKNTGTVRNENRGNTTQTNALQTKVNQNQFDSVLNYDATEKYSMQSGYFMIDDPMIQNPESRNISKSDSNSGIIDGTTDNTGTVTNDLNTDVTQINDLTNNVNGKLTDNNTRKGYTRPIWQIVEEYSKQLDPWEILWDALDPLFSSNFKVVY